MAAKTDWKDYVPNADGVRYRLTQNSDGTYTITDATTYEVVGDKVTAAQLNALGQAINVVDTATKSLVPNTRTVNGHALNANVTVTKSDVGLSKVNNNAITMSRSGTTLNITYS